MSMKLVCSCGKILKIPDSFRGRRGRCPNCATSIEIPAQDDELPDLQSQEGSTHAYRPEDLYERVVDSVVGIEGSFGSGSGVVMDSDGIIATNRHVLGTDHEVRVWLRDRIEYVGKPIRSYKDIDLGFVKVGLPQVKWAVLGKSNSLRVGETVYAVGHPSGLEHTFTKGIVSAVGRLIGGKRYVQTDATINPGNSGGPLFNGHGEVVGINTMGCSDATGLNFAIPSEMLWERYELMRNELETILEKTYCGICGRNSETPKYCDNCGAGLNPDRPVVTSRRAGETTRPDKTQCEICKVAVKRTDKYCPKCGSTL